MKKIKLILLPLIVLTLISCTCANHIGVELPKLNPLKYERITASEYQCLTDEVYLKFKRNDVLCKARVDTLNGIIGSDSKD